MDINMTNTGWFYNESAANNNGDLYKNHKSSFGAYQTEGAKGFDEAFADLRETYKAENGIDIQKDFENDIYKKVYRIYQYSFLKVVNNDKYYQFFFS